MNWKLEVLGVRGAIPLTTEEFREYGGNTPCFFLKTDTGEQIIFDAGTGIQYVKDDHSRPLHLLISHAHLDHINGITGFRQLYQKGREIHIYGEKRDGKTIREQLSMLLSPPLWPVTFEKMAASIQFHDITDHDSFMIGNIQVRTMRLLHQNTCTGFSVSDGKRKLCYLLDSEVGDQEMAEFIRKSDLIISDCTYSEEKAVKGSGHGSWNQWAEFSKLSDVRTVLASHYAFTNDDTMVGEQEKEADKWNAEQKNQNLEKLTICLFSREEMELEI